MNIGCHVSIAGGVWNAPKRAAEFGCECMQIFSRSPRGGGAPELVPEAISRWRAEIETHRIRATYIHTPYYINLASAERRVSESSARIIREELERGSMLGARYVMTHLGSAKDTSKEKAVAQTIDMLVKALMGYSGGTKLLLENAAGAGALIGDDMRELSTIIKRVNNKHIAGVCLDTQHAFAFGYDWRTKKSFADAAARIERDLGWEYVKLMHTNDSKVELGARRDRHEHIGDGHIGKEGFRYVTKLAREKNIDMIVETPDDKVAKDIAILKTFREKYSPSGQSPEVMSELALRR